MRHLFYFLAITFLGFSCSAPPPARVLIFSKTSIHGYRHQSIEAGKTALMEICYQNGIMADTTEDSHFFNEKNLKKYNAVIFLSTNGEVLASDEEADFERYIQAGGGFMGVHSTAATEYTWKWFGGLLGAYFKDHPAIQDVPLQVENCKDRSTAHLGCVDWPWKEEWYNFRNYAPDIEVLLSIDEDKYKGGSVPADTWLFNKHHHPIAWQHPYDGGRSFYTALGHIPEGYSDPQFRKHLLGGILYAIGKQDPLNYSRCRTPRRPDQTRFVKTVVADHLNEPMEMDQLPDGKILILERHGYIRLFDPATGLINVVAKLPVYSEMGDGMLGLAIDPQWEQNHRIFINYSSLRDSMNQLSRFVFQNDTLDRASEKVILTVPTGHTNCFHAGGSLAFGPDGYLYMSTGDNTSPFASDGFAPIDFTLGRQSFDALRSAGNTMDLRGKILRIKVAEDGTYTCPSDNLFVQSQNGRPEIYVMGCRNPFRISIDQRRNYLYWGEIGPDSGKNDTLRGPMGHDEINQARRAGNFGWPLFVGDNQAYRAYDFDQRKAGTWFDPQHPVNLSPNNTGARELPPAQPAFIWYPYGRNRDFPMLGEGGRNAMAGPVYYCDNYDARTRLPDYYNGKTLIYDWMRNWIMAVTVDAEGHFYHLEPIADSVKVMRPIDMLVDRKTGSIWLLEYGKMWYSSNVEACLSRIDFVRGNRKPIARLEVDVANGAAPLKVRFSLGKTEDYDHEPLEYALTCAGETLAKMHHPDTVTWQFPAPGRYKVVLKVSDSQGAFDTDTAIVYAGNTPPVVKFVTSRNRSFYRPGTALPYAIQVRDREDCPEAVVFCRQASVTTSADYFEKLLNPAVLPQKAEDQTETYARGKALIAGSDCYSCHAVDKMVNGPSFKDVAARYRGTDFSIPTIYRKIIYGGSGKWGQRAMIAHPNIREEEAIEMAHWIMALGDPVKPVQSLPFNGSYPFPAAQGTYLLQASYTDLGWGGLPALSENDVLVLRPATFEVEQCDDRRRGVGNYKPFDNDTIILNELKQNYWFVIKRVDLQHLKSLTLRIGSGDTRVTYCGGRMEIHLDKPNGPLLAGIEEPKSNEKRMVFHETTIPLPPSIDANYHDLYFVFKNEQNQGQGVFGIDWVRFDVD
jgi:cytochrome c